MYLYYILKCNSCDGKAMEAWSHHGVKNLTNQIFFFSILSLYLTIQTFFPSDL